MINYRTREDRVLEFFTAAGKVKYDGESFDDSVLATIEEESGEFISAAYEYEEAINSLDLAFAREARKGLVKELADLQYVVSQAAIYFDVPLDACFNRVHESNLSKLTNGEILYRADGKILKGPNYLPPDMSNL